MFSRILSRQEWNYNRTPWSGSLEEISQIRHRDDNYKSWKVCIKTKKKSWYFLEQCRQSLKLVVLVGKWHDLVLGINYCRSRFFNAKCVKESIFQKKSAVISSNKND